MARSFHNVEKSGFHKGEYVGYATVQGYPTVWHIVRDGRNGWKATAQNNWERQYVYDRTGIYQLVGANLETISGKLAGLNELASR